MIATNALERILKLPAKKRIDAIFEYENPQELISLMSAQDILLSVREIGAQDALELFELLAPKQVQEILDLEIWDADQLNPEKAGHYFSLLFAANADTAAEQIDGLDVELVGLMFKRVAEIYDTSLGEEPEDLSGLCSQSPDGRFIVCFSEDLAQAALARALFEYLDSLYARDMKKALSLLEKLRFELASGLENTSLSWRDNRLLDLGILPRMERLEYFSNITLKALKPQEISKPEPEQASSQLAMTRFFNNINDAYAFLKYAIHNSNLSLQKKYFEALAHAARNMHASLSGDFGEYSEMLKSAEYVKALCDYGLAQASLGKLEASSEALEKYGVKGLIRLGRTALVNMRKMLGFYDENFLYGENYVYADTPLREVARALSLSEPRFYEGLLDINKFEVRFFNTLIELNASLKAAQELRFRAQLLGPLGVGIRPAMLASHKSLAHAGMYGRFLVNSFLKKPDILAPVIYAELKKISMPEFQAWAKKVSDDLADKLVSAGAYHSDEAHERCSNFLSAVLAQLEQNPELLMG